MATITANGPQVTATDRFGFTLFMSVVFNAVFILGISFQLEDLNPDKTVPPPLEITLVPTRSEQAPDEADFLAQSNQIGGGQLEEKARLTTPSPALQSTADDTGAPLFMPKLEAQPRPNNMQPELLTASNADVKLFSQPEESPEMPNMESPTALDMVARRQEIVRLSAELDEKVQAYAHRPRRKFVHANTREYKYATYLAEWSRGIERIGNLNFPDEAKRRKLSGSLLLDVSINANGTVADITIRKTSGYKILDDAAIRIVRLGAPFAQFPDSFRNDVDILEISRTWLFSPGGRISTR